MKNLCFFAVLFSKHKLLIFGICNESNVWAKVYHTWKTDVYGSIIVENIVEIKLLLQFIEYLLDQRNNTHTKIAINSTIQHFEGCSENKYLLKVWSFLVYPPQNGSPVIFLWKSNGNHLLMANVFKLHEYQTFGLMKMHNMR